MLNRTNIYETSNVKLIDAPIIPRDEAVIGALVGSSFIEICDEVFDEDDVPSKMIFNLMLNFCADVKGYDVEDVSKLVSMPKKNLRRWQRVLKVCFDIPTSEDLNKLWKNNA